MPPAVTILFTQVFTTPGWLVSFYLLMTFRKLIKSRLLSRGSFITKHLVHTISDGDTFLRHLDVHFGTNFQSSDKTINMINLQNQKFRMIPVLLAVSKVEDLSLLAFPANCKMECIAQL